MRNAKLTMQISRFGARNSAFTILHSQFKGYTSASYPAFAGWNVTR